MEEALALRGTCYPDIKTFNTDSDLERESDSNLTDIGYDIQETTIIFDGGGSSHRNSLSYHRRLDYLSQNPGPPITSTKEFKLAQLFI